MEGNWVGVLIQHWIWYTSVGEHILVVAIDKVWLLSWDSKHPYLITNFSDIFNSMLHCNKIASKGMCFTLSLLLGNQINRRLIQENNESSSWSSSNLVFRVITINIYSHPESQSSGLSHIRWQFFFNVLKNTWRPVFTFEVFVFNIRLTWIK